MSRLAPGFYAWLDGVAEAVTILPPAPRAFAFDLTLEQAAALRDWLCRVLPGAPRPHGEVHCTNPRTGQFEYAPAAAPEGRSSVNGSSTA